MKLASKSGATIAMAAAALVFSAPVTAPTASASDAKVQCYGVNSCKGHGSCKTATNDCKGLNSCKGKGFVEMTAAECKAKGGTTES
jgi:hypothetical protein